MPTRTCPKCGSANVYIDNFQLKCQDCGYKELKPLTVNDNSNSSKFCGKK